MRVEGAGTAADQRSQRETVLLRALVYTISVAVVLLVAILMLRPPSAPPAGLSLGPFPGFHASLNGSVAVFLLAGFTAIRKRRIRVHRFCMVGAFALSSLFLVSYVFYHSLAPRAEFGGEGWIRPVYFVVLLTHVVLAAGILPLALFTLARAIRGEFPRHRRVARWTLPIWLYVAITGVAVYFMMRPYYQL